MPTRKEALDLGLSHYSGVACTKNSAHAPMRYVHNAACVACESEYGRARKRANAESERLRKAQWKVNNRARHLEQKAKDGATYKAKHAERLRLERLARYAADAPTRELVRLFDLDIATWEREKKRAAIVAEKLAMREAKALARAACHAGSNKQARKAQRNMRTSRLTGGNATKEEELDLLAQQGHACAWCGSKRKLELDHRQPIALGGSHRLVNLQWLCKVHNRKKGKMREDEARAKFGIPKETHWDAL